MSLSHVGSLVPEQRLYVMAVSAAEVTHYPSIRCFSNSFLGAYGRVPLYQSNDVFYFE